MERITIGQAQKMSAPNPFALLGYQMPNGTTNLMAVSWWNYASNRQPSLTVCLSKKGYANERIRETGVFTLNVVAEGMEESAFRCGTVSGRMCNKPVEFGIDLVDAAVGMPKGVRESAIVFSCRMRQEILIEDHILFVAEIVDIQANPKKRPLFAMNGYGYLAPVSPDAG